MMGDLLGSQHRPADALLIAAVTGECDQSSIANLHESKVGPSIAELRLLGIGSNKFSSRHHPQFSGVGI
jgi:hypothetical protein